MSDRSSQVSFVAGPVRVSVPATTANLGPGFDSLGLALGLRDALEAQVTDGGLVVQVEGEGANSVPRDDSHLVVRAMRAGFDALGVTPPGLRLACRNVIPHARGLGSSSAAIVGGLMLARGLVAGGAGLLDDAVLLGLATRLEGHPDNVAPALYGGFVICGADDGQWYAASSPVAPNVSAVVFVPPDGVSTELARSLLPATVPHEDAAANAGRTALLVAALDGQPEHLHRATRDFLHQEYRRSAMPASTGLMDQLRREGIAATISGAGPTVLALIAGEAGLAHLMAQCPKGWQVHHLTVDRHGARLV